LRIGALVGSHLVVIAMVGGIYLTFSALQRDYGTTARRANLLLLGLEERDLASAQGAVDAAHATVIFRTAIVDAAARSSRGARAFAGIHRISYVTPDSPPLRLVGGTWPPTADPTDLTPVAINQEFAHRYRVALRDEITWEVGGVPLPTRIVAVYEGRSPLRLVPDAAAFFPPGFLEHAPRTSAWAVRCPDEKSALAIEAAVKKNGVVCLDLVAANRFLESGLARLNGLFVFGTLLGLAMGTVNVIAISSGDRVGRSRELSLLVAVGAARRQIVCAALVEHFGWALPTAIVATIGALAATAWFQPLGPGQSVTEALPVLIGVCLGISLVTGGAQWAAERALLFGPGHLREV